MVRYCRAQEGGGRDEMEGHDDLEGLQVHRAFELSTTSKVVSQSKWGP